MFKVYKKISRLSIMALVICFVGTGAAIQTTTITREPYWTEEPIAEGKQRYLYNSNTRVTYDVDELSGSLKGYATAMASGALIGAGIGSFLGPLGTALGFKIGASTGGTLYATAPVRLYREYNLGWIIEEEDKGLPCVTVIEKELEKCQGSLLLERAGPGVVIGAALGTSLAPGPGTLIGGVAGGMLGGVYHVYDNDELSGVQKFNILSVLLLCNIGLATAAMIDNGIPGYLATQAGHLATQASLGYVAAHTAAGAAAVVGVLGGPMAAAGIAMVAAGTALGTYTWYHYGETIYNYADNLLCPAADAELSSSDDEKSDETSIQPTSDTGIKSANVADQNIPKPSPTADAELTSLDKSLLKLPVARVVPVHAVPAYASPAYAPTYTLAPYAPTYSPYAPTGYGTYGSSMTSFESVLLGLELGEMVGEMDGQGL